MVDKKTIAKIIGDNLKAFRTEKGLSMQALANLAEVEKSQIVRIEAGKVDVQVSSLYKISTAIGVDIKDLFNNIPYK